MFTVNQNIFHSVLRNNTQFRLRSNQWDDEHNTIINTPTSLVYIVHKLVIFFYVFPCPIKYNMGVITFSFFSRKNVFFLHILTHFFS